MPYSVASVHCILPMPVIAKSGSFPQPGLRTRAGPARHREIIASGWMYGSLRTEGAVVSEQTRGFDCISLVNCHWHSPKSSLCTTAVQLLSEDHISYICFDVVPSQPQGAVLPCIRTAGELEQCSLQQGRALVLLRGS